MAADKSHPIRDNAIKVIAAHLNEPPVSPSEHNPDIPADLEQIVLKAMSKDPADRPSTIAEFLLEFQTIKIFKRPPAVAGRQ